MNTILTSLLIGAVAGVIDVIPMIMQKLDNNSMVSAFVQWVVIGLIVSHVKIPGLDGWLKGVVVAVLMVLPIVIVVAKADSKSVPIILTMTVILGALVGFASSRFI